MTHRILILGATTEARQLAERLAGRAELEVTLSLAGRTASPLGQAVPVRIGGFGGADGLATYLRQEQVGLLVDATHPHAARISAHAALAAAAADMRVVALRRPPWQPVPGDRWTPVDDPKGAVAALGPAPRKVFLTLGRQDIAAFDAAPQHSYVVRSVDPVDPPLAVPRATYLLARGPFPEDAELWLLRESRIDAIVAKNSGGTATFGKIAAARALGIEVILLRQPALPPVETVESVDQAVAAVDHWLASERGV